MNSNQADTKIDQSLYNVTIRRYFGGAPEWTGEVLVTVIVVADSHT